jgi:putative oxygen-independent coproporphyrinogen III oxidase
MKLRASARKWRPMGLTYDSAKKPADAAVLDVSAKRSRADVSTASAPSAPGLYLHVPFCRTKCPYCDFYSVLAPASMVGRWLDAVSREMELHSGTFPSFDTLYIGGGTPSLLSLGELTALIGRLRERFDFADDTEITIEANPDDIDAGRLAAYRELGINRLSLGVQSFDNEELRFLRRRHDAASAVAALSGAREAGFANIGIDLIYGYEGQSLASWKRTLERAIEFSPEHISCYQMTIEPRTEFGRMLEAGSLTAADEESERSFFIATSTLLSERGYLHYEISNFARGEELVSRHNHKYWRHAPYLGLGPSAHSFQNGTRWWNVRSVGRYCESLERGIDPVDGREALEADQLALERVFLGFRTRDGVALSDLRGYRRWEGALEELIRESLVTVSRGRAVPTLEGLLVADRLPLAFTD